jgi:hypothetical protein
MESLLTNAQNKISNAIRKKRKIAVKQNNITTNIDYYIIVDPNENDSQYLFRNSLGDMTSRIDDIDVIEKETEFLQWWYNGIKEADGN